MAFPNLKGKHAEQSMIEPADFVSYAKKTGRCPAGRPPEGIILCYSNSLMKQVLQTHKTKELEGFGSKLYLLPETKNKIGIAGNFGIGAPVACVVLEELIAWGVKRFVTIGTAGTIQKNLDVGDIIVCNRAIRDEGTSHHYLKHTKYAQASKEMTSKIEMALKKLGQKYIIGTSWTIDAPYRETVKEARQYQKEGVATVEMEASALFAVAQYRKVPIGAIFTISDSLAELEWKPKFHLKKTSTGLEISYKIAKEALTSSP